jgi:hypothetical protein
MSSPGLSLFVVPCRNVHTLCTVENGRLIEIGPVPVPIGAKYAMNEHGWIVWVPEDYGGVIYRAHADAEPHEQNFEPIRMPGNDEVKAMAFRDQQLVVLGYDRGRIGFFCLDEATPPWVPLEWDGNPAYLAIRENTVLLAPSGNRNLRLSRYEIVPPRSLRLLATGEMRERPQEGIEALAAGRTWAVVLASGFQMVWEWLTLRFHDLSTLTEHACLAVDTVYGLTHTGAGGSIPQAPVWSDLVWVEDVLCIASGPRGVGILDLTGVPVPSPPPEGQPRTETDLARLCERRLFYIPLPSGVKGEVIRVIPAPASNQVLAVVKSDAGQDTVLLDLPPTQRDTGCHLS